MATDNTPFTAGWYIVCSIVGAILLFLIAATIFLCVKGKMKWRKVSVTELSSSYLMSTKFLLVIRIIFCAYLIAALVFQNVYYQGQFMYFTVWNFCLLAVYFGLATIYSFCLVLNLNFESMKAMRILARIGWIVLEMEMVLAFLVDLVFWAFVFRTYDYTTAVDYYVTISNHILNLVVVYVDFFLNPLPFFFRHVVFAMMFSLIFCIFQWAIFPSTKVWIYPILNVEKKISILWYILIFAAHVVFAGIAWLCWKLKSKIMRRFQAKKNAVQCDSEEDKQNHLTDNQFLKDQADQSSNDDEFTEKATFQENITVDCRPDVAKVLSTDDISTAV